jgi:hypothetical protein
MMSSFTNPHYIYLFAMKNGKKKLAYGKDPQDALEVLSFRLTPNEMAMIIPDQFTRISPRDIQQYVDEIG